MKFLMISACLVSILFLVPPSQTNAGDYEIKGLALGATLKEVKKAIPNVKLKEVKQNGLLYGHTTTGKDAEFWLQFGKEKIRLDFDREGNLYLLRHEQISPKLSQEKVLAEWLEWFGTNKTMFDGFSREHKGEGQVKSYFEDEEKLGFTICWGACEAGQTKERIRPMGSGAYVIGVFTKIPCCSADLTMSDNDRVRKANKMFQMALLKRFKKTAKPVSITIPEEEMEKIRAAKANAKKDKE